MSRAQLTSTVEQNTGGAVAPFLAGKNKIINGDFGIWQRGSSFSSTTNNSLFTADRWRGYTDGSGAFTPSQQTFTPGTAPVAGYEGTYFHRFQITSTGSSANFGLGQRLEDVRLFAGQTATVSFWAKADASRSITIYASQSFGSGGSSYNGVTAGSATVTTSWARYTMTFSMPSISGKTIGSGSYIDFIFALPLAVSTIDIWGVQVEAGSVATPFTTASNTLQGELALCMRYYQRIAGGAAYSFISSGIPASSTTIADFLLPLPVQMRTTPSSTIEVSNLACSDNTTNYSSGTFTFVSVTSGPSVVGLRYTHGSAALTQYRPYYLCNNSSASGYLGLSAEL